MKMGSRVGWGMVFGGIAAGTVACVHQLDDGTTGSLEQPVQYGYVGLPGQSGNGTYGLELLTSGSTSTTRAKASAAMQRTISGAPLESTMRISCGLTFVTQHQAITAGHCLWDQNDLPVPAGTPITVKQYDMSLYTTGSLFNNSRVTGTWTLDSYFYNQYQHYDQPDFLNFYSTTTYSCYTWSYCGPTGSRYHCPTSLAGVDLGVVRCDSRTVTNGHLAPVSVPPAVNQTIEVRWFHEILYLATNATFDDSNMPDGNWNHYGLYNPDNPLNNYHYHINGGIDGPHRLFPLLSKVDKNNTSYKILETSGNEWLVSARGCHGTSGSGVFKSGANTFYGVVVGGGNGWATTKICDDLTQTAGTAADGEGVTMIPPSKVRTLYDHIASTP